VERDLRKLVAVPHQPGGDHLPKSVDERLELGGRLPEERWALNLQKRMCVEDSL
jgi:hypothetical protein